MASEKVKPCPLCGRKAHAIQPIAGKDRAWNIGCGTDNPEHDPADQYGCGLVLFGGDNISKSEMAKRWNTRG